MEIDEKTGKIRHGIRLFKRYFIQYQKWRDNGIKKAKNALKDKTNVLIMQLDIKDYFNSICISFDKIKEKLKDKQEFNENIIFHEKMEEIHSIYTNLLCSCEYLEINNKDHKEYLLPIGMLSSGILANWYLNDFDQLILKELNPLYYGRYVDDILIVLTNYNNDCLKFNNHEFLDFYLKNYFKNIIKEINNNEYEISINKLLIQKEKIKLYILDSNYSRAVLENIEKTIRKNSSEFRLLPEDFKVNIEFQDEAYKILYGDSIYKLRSVESFKHDKYGATTYLAKKIFSCKFWDGDGRDINLTKKQIMSFFQGRFCLEFYTLWERIFTYFFINNLTDETKHFLYRVKGYIDKIIVENKNKINEEKLTKKIKDDLIDFLQISFSIALSLNLESEIFKQVPEDITKNALNMRKSNLLRHELVFYPLMNYIKEDVNLLDKLLVNKKNINFDLDE